MPSLRPRRQLIRRAPSPPGVPGAPAQGLGGGRQTGCDAGFVFSNEHYEGDVPYLGGNTNITVEQVAGVIGANGFHLIAGLEGGYVVERLAVRSGSPVHKVEMLATGR